MSEDWDSIPSLTDDELWSKGTRRLRSQAQTKGGWPDLSILSEDPEYATRKPRSHSYASGFGCSVRVSTAARNFDNEALDVPHCNGKTSSPASKLFNGGFRDERDTVPRSQKLADAEADRAILQNQVAYLCDQINQLQSAVQHHQRVAEEANAATTAPRRYHGEGASSTDSSDIERLRACLTNIKVSNDHGNGLLDLKLGNMHSKAHSLSAAKCQIIALHCNAITREPSLWSELVCV